MGCNTVVCRPLSRKDTPWGIYVQVLLGDRPEREGGGHPVKNLRDDVSRFWDLEPPEQGFDENPPTIDPAGLPLGRGWLASGSGGHSVAPERSLNYRIGALGHHPWTRFGLGRPNP
jgi:hypothetical protein